MSFLGEIINETRRFSDLLECDINNELPSKTSCKYYSVNEFQNLNTLKTFNIFHTNINGLGSKLDNLSEFLTGTPTKMGILAITETLENNDTGFITYTL